MQIPQASGRLWLIAGVEPIAEPVDRQRSIELILEFKHVQVEAPGPLAEPAEASGHSQFNYQHTSYVSDVAAP
jgi:hypothetical protein